MIPPFFRSPKRKKGIELSPFPIPFLLFLLDLLLLFLLLIRFRRGGKAASNVLRNPRRSDPVEAIERFDPSVHFIKTHAPNESTYDA